MRRFILLLAIICTLCSATRIGGFRKPPKGFVEVPAHKRAVLNDGELKVTLGLKQRNLDILEEKFWAVSDPKNPDYGNHLSFKQVVDLVAPHQESIDAVKQWLSSNGVEESKMKLTPSRDFLKVSMSAEQVETLFNAPLTAYAHEKRGYVNARMDRGYELPSEVSGLVDIVSQFMAFHEVIHMDVPAPLDDVSVKAVTPHNAARASNTPPTVVLAYTQDTAISFYFFIFCLDGSTPSISQGSPVCGSLTATAVEITATNTVSNSQIGSLNLQIGSCTTCGKDSTCKNTNNPSSNVLCFSSTITNLTNYLPISYTFATVWNGNGGNTLSNTVSAGPFQTSATVVPSVISSTYGIPAGTQVTQSSNNQSVIEFDEGYLLSDVKAYFSATGLTDNSNQLSNAGPFSVPNNKGAGEGILDIIAIMGTARNCKTIYFSEANAGDPFLNWITDILNDGNAPIVQSVSYGDEELAGSSDGRINAEFIKAGSQGISIIVSSGDDGVQASTAQDVPAFEPDFPATSPYVTAVGATMLVGKTTTSSCYDSQFTTYTCDLTEIAASPSDGAIIASGGGFSNVFAQPSYQSSAVSAYLNANSVGSGVNKTGRGYPDVSALGHNVAVFLGGTATVEDGTSASAPFFAGMVTLWNDVRLSQGKGSLGFLNPFLYSLDSSNFNDVTSGSNFCVPDECTTNGFNAVAGWDPITGLGTPNFQKISSAVSALPSSTSTIGTNNAATVTSGTSSSSSSGTSLNPTISGSTTSPSNSGSSTSGVPIATTSSTSSSSSLSASLFCVVVALVLVFTH